MSHLVDVGQAVLTSSKPVTTDTQSRFVDLLYSVSTSHDWKTTAIVRSRGFGASELRLKESEGVGVSEELHDFPN